MYLCDACRVLRPNLHQGLVDHAVLINLLVPHHSSAQRLQKACGEGCAICKRLWPKLVAAVGVAHAETTHPSSYCLALVPGLTGLRAMDDAKITFYCKFTQDDQETMLPVHTVRCTAIATDRAPEDIVEAQLQQHWLRKSVIRSTPYSIPQHSGAKQCLELAKAWLNKCNKHEKCSRGGRGLGYPRRLLQLPGSTDKVKLVSTGLEMANRYATLSHCWGGNPTFRLLTANGKRFQDGIFVHQLPASYRDAIAACMALDIGHLWIDSLCILQDSANDWRDQSAQMQQIYQHAKINLSASGTENSIVGCFFHRDVRMIRPLPPCPPFQNYDWTSELQRSGEEYKYFLVDEDFWEQLCEDSPVFHRAWIFQERLLAHRVLHFGRTQMFWECQTARYCETFPDGLPPQLQPSEAFPSKALYHDVKVGETGIMSMTGKWFVDVAVVRQEKRIRYWETLVSHYTRCKLTIPGDKLVALSGIAMDWNGATSGTYAAGIWKSHMPMALLWHTVGTISRPQKYRAPSWSWAAGEGEVRWSEARWSSSHRCTARSFGVGLDYIDNEWSELRGGHLVIRGPFMRLKFKLQAEIPTSIQPWVSNYPRVPISSVLLDVTEGARLDRTAIARWYALSIVHYSDTKVEAPRALVLVPVLGHRDVYRRVGVLCTGPSADVQSLFDKAEDKILTIV